MCWAEQVLSSGWPDCADEHLFQKLVEVMPRWCEASHVVDEWLLNVCLETVVWWTLNFDNPNTRLADGYPWYHFSHLERDERGRFRESAIPKFVPIFEDAWPQQDAPPELVERILYGERQEAHNLSRSVRSETLEQFEKRMRSDFDRQLRAYMKSLRQALNFDSRPQESEHADWAAVLFAGATDEEAARLFQKNAKGYPDTSTLCKGATRFAKRIGLTLLRGQAISLWGNLGDNNGKS